MERNGTIWQWSSQSQRDVEIEMENTGGTDQAIRAEESGESRHMNQMSNQSKQGEETENRKWTIHGRDRKCLNISY